jgi:cation:H+ antiporter
VLLLLRRVATGEQQRLCSCNAIKARPITRGSGPLYLFSLGRTKLHDRSTTARQPGEASKVKEAGLTGIVLFIGLALLLGGGEALVRGSVGVATRLGMSPLLIGLTLVGFGTSTPELVASIQAALIDAPGIAVGNVVGSNIANILLILGVAALIMPITTSQEAFRRDGTVLIAASLLLLAVVVSGTIGRMAGAIFLLLLAGYTIYTYRTERRTPDAGAQMHAAEAAEFAPPRGMSLGVALTLALGGIAAVVFGAHLLVQSSIEIARSYGLSEAVIGLTLVAVGTSLPELATSVIAAIRRHGDVAFGNIVGSNIFNALGIAGTTAIVTPIAVPAEIIRLDIWVMMATAVLLVVFAISGWRISRKEAAVFLVAYGGYLLVQLSPAVRQALGLI